MLHYDRMHMAWGVTVHGGTKEMGTVNLHFARHREKEKFI